MADNSTASSALPLPTHPSSLDKQDQSPVTQPMTDLEMEFGKRPVDITVAHAGLSETIYFMEDAVLAELTDVCMDFLGYAYDWNSAKFIAPQYGLLKAAEKGDFPLIKLKGKKLTLLVPKIKDITNLHAAEEAARRRDAARRRAESSARHHHRGHHTDQATAIADATYTFLQLRPLDGLPRPERSLKFLQRLKEDPGIRAAMRKHKFTVALLTEMDPLSYTESNHEGTTRILGLNRNKGEVIELRLRTDAYDGYRDYKTIRKTLCHELAHNVHGPHDRNFWDLCRQIEREVEAADWKSGGRTVGNEEYAPSRGDDEEEIVHDHGGWTGGEFVLGRGPSSAPSTSSTSSTGGNTEETLSRRDILRRAAEERIRKMNDTRRPGEPEEKDRRGQH